MMKSRAAILFVLVFLTACRSRPPQTADQPPPPDSDGDGVVDAQDGCPDVVDQFPVTDLVIPEKIYFDHDDWKIKPVSHDVLQAVVDFLVSMPQIELVRIIGHRDPSEPDEYALELSKKRADSVRDFLIQHGVEPERLEAVGMGDSEPAEPYDDVDQAALNRRVTFEIVE